MPFVLTGKLRSCVPLDVAPRSEVCVSLEQLFGPSLHKDGAQILFRFLQRCFFQPITSAARG